MNRRLLVITLSFLLGLDSIILMEHLGIHIPLVRQFFGFIALTFLPGYLVLRTFRPTTESFSEVMFFSAALSISIVMFAGIFANFIFPFFGIDRPITLGSVLITFNVIVLVLLIIHQRLATSAQGYRAFNFMRVTKWDLFFFLLPLFSIISAHRFSFCGDNRGLIALYFLISLIPLIFIRVRDFNRTFAIWSIAISLMWSTVFGMSWNYIWGYDINGEYYYANLILSRGIWNISVSHQYNIVASVNILAPVYSLILNIPLVPIFKVMYPLLFSLVPVILLRAYEKLLKKELWAELSVLFFMFFFTFFTEMMALARQMIAEIYLALVVYAFVRQMPRVFLLIFLLSLVISHYGMAYLLMFALLAIVIVSHFTKNNKVVSELDVAIFWIFTFTWYQHIGGGFQFYNFINIGYITLLMIRDILNPLYSQGLAILVTETTLGREITKWINVMMQGLIALGILTETCRRVKKRSIYNLEFYIASIIFFAYGIAGLIIPFFANWLNASRLYQIALFFLAPYLVVGVDKLVQIVQNFNIGTFSPKLSSKRVINITAGLLLVYFLFNSGVMLEITNDPQPAQWLDRVHSPAWSSQEIVGAYWVKEHKLAPSPVWLGNFKFPLFLGLGIKTKSFGKDVIVHTQDIPVYVYLGKDSVEYGEVESFYIEGIPKHEFIPIRATKLWTQLIEFEKIYENGNVWIYFVPDRRN